MSVLCRTQVKGPHWNGVNYILLSEMPSPKLLPDRATTPPPPPPHTHTHTHTQTNKQTNTHTHTHTPQPNSEPGTTALSHREEVDGSKVC